MTRLGTAFVEIKPDWSNFDRAVGAHLPRTLKASGGKGGGEFGKAFESRFSGIVVPLTKDISDEINTTLRTKIKAPEIPAPKVGVPVIPAPELPDFDLTDKTVTLDLQIKGAEAEAAKVRASIATLTAQPQTIDVQVATGKALADLDRINAKVTALSAKRAEVNVDVDQSTPSILDRITSSVSNLFTSLGGGGGGGLNGATTRVSAGFVSFGAVAGPLAAILAALAVTVGVALVAAFAALASSMALAVAGAAALGAALAGVLGPAVGLAIAVATRLGKVFEALKAGDAARDQASQNALAGSQAAAAASSAQEAAARSLTDANRQLGEATTAAYREMADAAEAASDAIRGVTDAQLSLDRAEISTERAILDLQQFREEIGATGDAFGDVFEKFRDVSVDTSGLRAALAEANDASGGQLDARQELDLRDKILKVREARQAEKNAIDGVSDATTAASRALARHNEFVKQGKEASAGYRAALRGVQAATLAVAQAQDQQGFSAAQAKAIDLTSKLTEREQRLLEVIQRVRDELRGAFMGATDAVFGGMIKALGRLPALVNPLRGAFKRLGEAWGGAIDAFSRDLIRPDSLAKLKAFTEAGARLAGPVQRGISALLDILTDIGRAALPYLVSGTEKVADKLEEWARATGHTKRLGANIGRLIGHLKTWLGVAGSIADVFLAFIPVAAADGKSLAESIKGLADRTARWLRSSEGQEKVRQFFADVIPLARDFVGLMLALTKAFVRVGQVIAPIVSFLVRLNQTLLDLRNNAIGKFVTAIESVAGAIGGKFTEAISGLSGQAKGAGLRIAQGLAAGVGNAPAQVAAVMREVLVRAITELRNALGPIFARGRALMVSLRDGVASFGEALVDKVREKVTAALEAVKGMGDLALAAGRSIGRGIRDGITAGLGALESIGTTVLNALISVLNRGMQAINDLLPDKIALKAAPDVNLPDNPLPQIPKFNTGGIVPGFGNRDTRPAMLTPGEAITRKKIVMQFGPTVFADINEGRLDPRVGYQDGERPSVGTRPTSKRAFATGGLVGAARPALATAEQAAPQITIPVSVVGGDYPDADDFAAKTMRAVEARTGGFPRQN